MKEATEQDLDYVIKEYECGYCGYKFQHVVRSILNEPPAGYEAHVLASTQVRCPYCHNFLKTWEEGKVIGKTDKPRPRIRGIE